MLRSFRRCSILRQYALVLLPKRTFLTNEYKSNEAWKLQISSPILTKVNLNDFYNILDQNFLSKGIISAIDVDIFANAVRDPVYLEELKDLLHKLRLSAETGNTLESTHHATIRNYMEFGNIQELIQILQDPLNFGVFLDFYTANMLLDKLITSQEYEYASNVASFIMLQEDFTNDITNTLCQYASYKYLSEYMGPSEEPIISQEENKKKEEIKIRIKFLRNPYFDDHFDIKDLKTLSGKTLALMSKSSNDNVSCNLQIIGWLFYKKYDKLFSLCKQVAEKKNFKLCTEVVELINKEIELLEEDTKIILCQCIEVLNKAPVADTKLENSLKIAIENAINRIQNKDIAAQKKVSFTNSLIQGVFLSQLVVG